MGWIRGVSSIRFNKTNAKSYIKNLLGNVSTERPWNFFIEHVTDKCIPEGEFPLSQAESIMMKTENCIIQTHEKYRQIENIEKYSEYFQKEVTGFILLFVGFSALAYIIYNIFYTKTRDIRREKISFKDVIIENKGYYFSSFLVICILFGFGGDMVHKYNTEYSEKMSRIKKQINEL